ncbi:head maturation protease, ClpP-related [Paenibacillus lautus]|uniref:head maturation protease, ClpP-related n=1 Tax=Paenibacillus lautus TaxID=1401 RepID=UPI003D27C9C9
MSNFWEFRNISESEGELILYGPIASAKPWWADEADGIYANQFTKDLKALGNISHLTMRINSGGGDVFAANAIYAQLKSHPAKVTGVIEGVAASAATILLAACDTVKAWSNATLMVHLPLAGLMGYYNVKDLEKVSAILDTVKASIINAYISKTGRTSEELSAMLEEEKWMTAEEGLSDGFVDEIMNDVIVEATMTADNRFAVVNSIAHDLSGFGTRPEFTAVSMPVIVKEPVVSASNIKNNQRSDDTMAIKNLAELREAYPDLCNQLETEVKNSAASAERERIKSIDEISNTIAPELVNKAKYEEPVTAENLAFQALKADAGKGLNFLNIREGELKNNGNVTSELTPPDPNNKQEKEQSYMNSIADAMNANRKQKEGAQ